MTFEPLLILAAGPTFEPLTLGAGATSLGLALVLVRVLLKNVSGQGGGWETLSHAQQADASSARAETASVREQKDAVISAMGTEISDQGAVIRAMGIEISDLKQQLRDRGPLP